MKRFSFGTFLVDDSNRKAFEVCRDVANLQPLGSGPSILLGDPGCGKTHLLYAIVNRTRAGATGTGVAYITADDFPKQVRNLTRDPSPVQRAKSAILIVDSLERFKDGLDDLEAVVRLFLANNHYVVLATAVNPNRLRNLTQGLRAIIGQGSLIHMLASDTSNSLEQMAQRIRKEAEEVITSQTREIEELKAQSNNASASPDVHASQAQGSEAETQLEELRKQMAGAETELEHLRAENSLLSVSAREVGPLRERIEELQDQYEEARAKLEPATAEESPARQGASEVLSEAEVLMDEVENNRSEPSAVEHRTSRQREEIRELEAALGSDASDAPGSKAPTATTDDPQRELKEATLRSQFQQDQDQLRESFKTVEGRQKDEIANQQCQLEAISAESEEKAREMDRLRAEMNRAKGIYSEIQTMVGQANDEIERLGKAAEEAESERDRIREELEKVIGGHDALKTAAEDAQEEARQFREQAEALRREAEERKTADAARIDELKRDLAESISERDHALQMNQVVSDQLRSLRTVLTDGSQTVDVLAQTLGTSPDTGEAAPVSPPAPDKADTKKKQSAKPVGPNVVTAEFGRRTTVAPEEKNQSSSLHHVEQLHTDRDLAPPEDTESDAPRAQEDHGND